MKLARLLAVFLAIIALAGCTALTHSMTAPQTTSTQSTDLHDFGSKVQVKTDEYTADISIGPKHKYNPKSGKLAFLVTVHGISGTTPVNPMYVSITSKAGDSHDVILGGVTDQLPAKHIGPGLTIRGYVAFKLPQKQFPGAHIEWDDVLGNALAYWKV